MKEELVYCPYRKERIDPGLCYDLQMIAGGYITPEALPDAKPDASRLQRCCQGCAHEMKGEKSMNEIISPLNKKSYIFLLVASLISGALSTRYLRIPMLQYIAMPMLVLFGLFAVFCLYMLLDPHGVVERSGDRLILRMGVRKVELDIQSITQVTPAPHPNDPNTAQKNAILIQYKEDGAEKQLICGDIPDVAATVNRLTDLINATK